MKLAPILSISALLFTGVTQQACRPGDPARVAAIDSLLTTTDSLTTIVNAIDLRVYQRMDSVFGGQRSWIEAQFADTLDRERAMILGNYHRAMSKSLGRVIRHHGEMEKELAYSREQLNDLRHDVDRGLLPDNPKETYFGQERLVLRQLSSSIDVLRSSANTAQREWDRYHMKVDSLMTADSTSTAP